MVNQTLLLNHSFTVEIVNIFVVQHVISVHKNASYRRYTYIPIELYISIIFKFINTLNLYGYIWIVTYQL